MVKSNILIQFELYKPEIYYQQLNHSNQPTPKVNTSFINFTNYIQITY